MAAIRSKADVKLSLGGRAANDPKRTLPAGSNNRARNSRSAFPNVVQIVSTLTEARSGSSLSLLAVKTVSRTSAITVRIELTMAISPT